MIKILVGMKMFKSIELSSGGLGMVNPMFHVVCDELCSCGYMFDALGLDFYADNS